MVQSPTNNIPSKGELTKLGTISRGAIYEVDGQPGVLCFISRQDGREYGITHNALPASCVEVDLAVYGYYGRSISVQSGVNGATDSDTIYSFADANDLAQLNIDLAALYPDFEEVTLSGSTLLFKTAVNTVAADVTIDFLNLYCAKIERGGDPDAFQLSVDTVAGTEIDTSSITTELQLLTAIQADYPELNVQDITEEVDATLGTIWLLSYLTDGVDDVITAATVDSVSSLLVNSPCSQQIPLPPPEGLGQIPEVDVDGNPLNTLATLVVVRNAAGSSLQVTTSDDETFTP